MITDVVAVAYFLGDHFRARDTSDVLNKQLGWQTGLASHRFSPLPTSLLQLLNLDLSDVGCGWLGTQKGENVIELGGIELDLLHTVNIFRLPLREQAYSKVSFQRSVVFNHKLEDLTTSHLASILRGIRQLDCCFKKHTNIKWYEASVSTNVTTLKQWNQ